ncbi:MAG: VOC family protein [Acidobacteria bacterium]|nr:VOC family protein [Acidobacteriota bacterium]
MFKVDQVDHIHVFVSDQYKAAEWYAKILGLEILEEHEDWAFDGGPLTISSDGGNTSLALFQKGNSGETNRSTVAFRVTAENFLRFLTLLDENEVFGLNGHRVSRKDVSDHEKAYSIYLCDEDKNPIEITTYEYELVKGRLN